MVDLKPGRTVKGVGWISQCQVTVEGATGVNGSKSAVSPSESSVIGSGNDGLGVVIPSKPPPKT